MICCLDWVSERNHGLRVELHTVGPQSRAPCERTRKGAVCAVMDYPPSFQELQPRRSSVWLHRDLHLLIKDFDSFSIIQQSCGQRDPRFSTSLYGSGFEGSHSHSRFIACHSLTIPGSVCCSKSLQISVHCFTIARASWRFFRRSVPTETCV